MEIGDVGHASASAKRLGTDRSEKRTAMIDAAEALLNEDGYAALTSRRVAERAGLKHQLIFYYFRAFEDLLLEVLRRLSDRSFAQLEAAVAAPQPLRALWALSRDTAASRFVPEFVALANHNPAVRDAIGAFATRYREAQTTALARLFAERAMPPGLSPEIVSVLMSTVSSGLTLEAGLGLTLGHADVEALVERLIARFEGEAAADIDHPVRTA